MRRQHRHLARLGARRARERLDQREPTPHRALAIWRSPGLRHGSHTGTVAASRLRLTGRAGAMNRVASTANSSPQRAQ